MARTEVAEQSRSKSFVLPDDAIGSLVQVSFFRVSELSWDVPVDAGFLCDAVAVLGDTIKGTLCTSASYSQDPAFTIRFGSYPSDLG